MTLSDELADVLRAETARHHVPGAAAGVLVDGQVHTASCGVTSVDHPLDVDSATLFQVASITKTFTAAAVMVLVEQGRLALTDPVGRHLPALASQTGLDTDALTIEHLLSHQGGFDGDHLFVQRVDELAALRDATRLFAPGRGFSYNNAAFSIAGEVIAVVSEQPFETFVRKRLLRPLGLKSASFRADDAITHRVAMPHFTEGDNTIVLRRVGWQPGWELTPLDRAAGGLIASVDHLLAWAQFQWQGTATDGSRILSDESLTRLHTPVVNVDVTSDVALDWLVQQHDGVTTISHSGVTIGYCSELVVAPERRIAIACLTNAVNGGTVNEAIKRWAMARCAGVAIEDPIPDPGTAPDLAGCSGEFRGPFARLLLAPGKSEGTVVVTEAPRDDVDGWQPPVAPPITFAFFAPDHAVSLDAPGPPRVLRVEWDDDGVPRWLLWSSRQSPRVRAGARA
jgi:CubicO group peptidase (beta-lactamase class C family)